MYAYIFRKKQVDIRNPQQKIHEKSYSYLRSVILVINYKLICKLCTSNKMTIFPIREKWVKITTKWLKWSISARIWTHDAFMGFLSIYNRPKIGHFAKILEIGKNPMDASDFQILAQMDHFSHFSDHFYTFFLVFPSYK